MNAARWPTIRARRTAAPPTWAILQRQLMDVMAHTARVFVDRYTRSDGTLIWRSEWPGMDGSDDGYESFHSFPLLYLLGGSSDLLDLARKEWDAVTWQFTEYGQVYREFDAYYDWMHHGESSILLYYLGLADPTSLKERQRAIRFAGFYTGEDPEARNYDTERRMIRSPITGSRGPRLKMSAEDWCTHREILAGYPAPFEDIPGVEGPVADWNDDRIFSEILRLMNQRMAKGDVPLNLMATSLVTHAYLFMGEDRYREWVLDYVGAWRLRAEANGGIVPDNVGPRGHVGECLDGKWWGGYYGWRWPHGEKVLSEAVLVGASNAALVDGDVSHLDVIRAQLDALWALRKRVDDDWHLPTKHLDAGWSDYRPADPRLAILLWNVSMAEEDRARIERLGDSASWNRVLDTIGKGDQAHTLPWYQYITGRFPEYPERILQLDLDHVGRRMQAIRADDTDPATWDVHHWQDHNPVLCEGLVQTMLGCPQPVYHGGLLHAPIRYFDEETGRSGLPESVGALVESVDDARLVVTLANIDPVRSKRLVAQAGAFAEHLWEEAIEAGERGDEDGQRVTVDGPWLGVDLPPSGMIRLSLRMQRYARPPAYGFPWKSAWEDKSLLHGRMPNAEPHQAHKEDA